LPAVDNFHERTSAWPVGQVKAADAVLAQPRPGYQQAVVTADATGRQVEARVYRLLGSLCSLHRAGAFDPKLVLDDRRTAIQNDFRGEQNPVLAAILSNIFHPGLRAQVADVVWTNDRRQVGADGMTRPIDMRLMRLGFIRLCERAVGPPVVKVLAKPS
jgi:hypothetical protein